MNNKNRRNIIIDIVNDLNEVSINLLGKKFGVSKSTIYRDLILLDKQGQLKKTIRGAIKIEEFLIEEDSYFANGLKIKNAEKRAIAIKALGYIGSDESIILDAGTANFLLAKEIKNSDLWDLTVVTNNIITQLLLVKNRNLRVVAPGGLIMEGCYSALGDFLGDMLKNISANIVFITTKGISLDGSISEFEYSESKIKQLFLQKSRKKILMFNSTKFGRMGIYKVANLTDFDVIITDSGITKEHLEVLKKTGVKLEIVKS